MIGKIDDLDWPRFDLASVSAFHWADKLAYVRALLESKRASSIVGQRVVALVADLVVDQLAPIWAFDLPLTLSCGGPDNLVHAGSSTHKSAHHLIAHVTAALRRELLGDTVSDFGRHAAAYAAQLYDSEDRWSRSEREIRSLQEWMALDLARIRESSDGGATPEPSDADWSEWLRSCSDAAGRIRERQLIPDYDPGLLGARIELERAFCFNWLYEHASEHRKKDLVWIPRRHSEIDPQWPRKERDLTLWHWRREKMTPREIRDRWNEEHPDDRFDDGEDGLKYVRKIIKNTGERLSGPSNSP